MPDRWVDMNKRIELLILMPFIVSFLAFILLLVSWNSVGFATWYARFVYPVLVHVFGRFFNLFPFSMFELGLFVLIPAGLIFLIYYVMKNPKAFKRAGLILLWHSRAGSSPVGGRNLD